MALVTASTAARVERSITEDIANLIERVAQVQKGTTKFVDVNQKKASAAMKRLQEAKGFLDGAFSSEA